MTRTPWWMAMLCVGLALAGCNFNKSASQPTASQPMTAAATGTEPMAPQQVVSQAGAAAPAAATTAQLAAASVPATAGEIGSPMDIQTALSNAGFYKGAIDGKIGPATRQAIEEFQRANGLTADGKVGTKTWSALKAHLASSSTQAPALAQQSQ